MKDVYEVPMQVIYILERPDHLCKIGRSSTPDFREKTICSIGGMEIINSYETPYCSNAHVIEHKMHEYYEKDREIGEWFSIDFHDAVIILQKIFDENANDTPKTKRYITPEMIDEAFAKRNTMPLPKKENNISLPELKMWDGQRVVTFKDIDIVHGRKNGDASRNFRNNKKHFNLNEDYYVLTKEQCNGKNLPIANIPPKGLTLLTETGYLMIVKSFTDDLSWEVQRRLVNSYFKVQEPALVPATIPTCALAKNKQKTWSEKNLWKFQKICKDMDWELKYLYHKILTEVGDLWNLDVFKDQYFEKYYREPKYNMDLINEFPHLQEIANKYLNYLMDAFGDIIV